MTKNFNVESGIIENNLPTKTVRTIKEFSRNASTQSGLSVILKVPEGAILPTLSITFRSLGARYNVNTVITPRIMKEQGIELAPNNKRETLEAFQDADDDMVINMTLDSINTNFAEFLNAPMPLSHLNSEIIGLLDDRYKQFSIDKHEVPVLEEAKALARSEIQDAQLLLAETVKDSNHFEIVSINGQRITGLMAMIDTVKIFPKPVSEVATCTRFIHEGEVTIGYTVPVKKLIIQRMLSMGGVQIITPNQLHGASNKDAMAIIIIR